MLSDFRRHPRYFLPAGLHASLAEVEANVVDLSVKGARLQVLQPLVVGAKLPFALVTSGGTITTGATVLWCQMAALALDDEESDRYLAGIVFDVALPLVAHVLDMLIASEEAIAIQDSRTTERYCVGIPLAASFGEKSEVRVSDLSIRGARINCREQIRIGTKASLRFRLEPGPAVDVEAIVVWCRPCDRKIGYEIGLAISNEEPLLRAVVAQMCMRKQARVDLNSLRRKFDPMRSAPLSGLVALAS
jgi:hypothetical protein